MSFSGIGQYEGPMQERTRALATGKKAPPPATAPPWQLQASSYGGAQQHDQQAKAQSSQYAQQPAPPSSQYGQQATPQSSQYGQQLATPAQFGGQTGGNHGAAQPPPPPQQQQTQYGQTKYGQQPPSQVCAGSARHVHAALNAEARNLRD